jgi:pimeloyl-ACP methyl ester carboxylesterase
VPNPTEPISQYYYSHRLKLHFWDWGNQGKPNLVLVHGGRDHARSWDLVANAFAADYHVVAPDLRGHGDSSWAFGAMYSVAEYVLDLSALLDIVDRFPVYLIGHSLGGAVVLQYAGTYPERVAKLVCVEGFARPPESWMPRAPRARLRKWIDDMRGFEHREPHRYPTLDAAVARMKEANPYLSDDLARHLTLYGSNWNPDGTLCWKFDNYVRAFSPYGFNLEDALEIWRGIECPAHLFRGADSWEPDPEQAGLIHAIRRYRLINVPHAGHWVHHDQPELFIAETRKFLAEH